MLPDRPRPDRGADRRAELARLAPALQARPLGRDRRAAARARARARRLGRAPARVARRPRGRLDGLDDPRRPADPRRRALPDGRLARRARPPLGPRRPHRLHARPPGAARPGAGARRSGRAARPRLVPPAAAARGPGRRGPRLPRPRLERAAAARPALLRRTTSRRRTPSSRSSRWGRSRVEYRLPDRSLLHKSAPGVGPERRGEPARLRGAAQCLANFGVEATVDRDDLRPAGHPLRAPARPRHQGREGRPAPRRPLLRARDDRDPHPRPDPRQAGRRRRGAEPLPEPRHARRHLRRHPAAGEPARRLAREGDRRRARLLRPRPDAAPADRRHHRLGQVGLHQRDPHLDPAPLDARPGADDPDRPEADRAQPLRVDPAPADAGRLEPQGGERRPAQRRHRDGAPLRAPLPGPGPRPARGEPRLPQARRAGAARTCSS